MGAGSSAIAAAASQALAATHYNVPGRRSSSLKAGLEKPVFFFFKPAQWVFWVFLGFFGFFIYICPEERVFRVFSVSRILLGASRL
jgi:hypothetical protein